MSEFLTVLGVLVFLGLFTWWCTLPPCDDFESYVFGLEDDGDE